jgi:hypothetical protein
MIIETARNFSHLQDCLFEGSFNPGINRFRSAWAFRGLSDAGYSIVTSLMRLGGEYARLERHLMRNFIKYAHRDVEQEASLWHWLSVAQHHGLPTRLLDWTYSPLVAVHFATSNIEKFDIDGAIWAVNCEEANKRLPAELCDALVEEGANIFTTQLLSKVVDTLDHFDRLSSSPFLLFFEPPSMDDRIVNQYALFSVISDPTLGLDNWFDSHPDICRKIVIPAALKWEVRDKLDQCNLTERVLFPGLDGLSTWLKRHYSPSGQQ